ncbi:MAG: hypothetical protein WC471_00945 [Candidatus Woesearchaeota archaeon]
MDLPLNYDSYYKFQVSLGLILFIFAAFFPTVFTNNILNEFKDLKETTFENINLLSQINESNSNYNMTSSLIKIEQQMYSVKFKLYSPNYLRVLELFDLFLLFLGALMFYFGMNNWKDKQNLMDLELKNKIVMQSLEHEKKIWELADKIELSQIDKILLATSISSSESIVRYNKAKQMINSNLKK